MPMQNHIVSAPFVGQRKLHMGSKQLHVPLDVDELVKRKTITLLGTHCGVVL